MDDFVKQSTAFKWSGRPSMQGFYVALLTLVTALTSLMFLLDRFSIPTPIPTQSATSFTAAPPDLQAVVSGDTPAVAPVTPPPPAHNHSAPSRRAAFKHIAVALKTGAETAIERAPVQLLTFLKDIENVILIAEAPNVRVGELPVHDVYTALYDEETESTGWRSLFKRAETTSGKREVEQLAETEGWVDSHNVYNRAEEELKPDESSEGWKLDAHKNLPGFKLLYDTYPDAHWYMMIDDDTYVFFDTLIYALGAAGFDYRQPWYFGAGNIFAGCDGVTKMGDGPVFAHGGTGILMSQGAVKKIAEPTSYRKCVNRYKDCWAGDIRTALCLRDGSVLISRLAGFNGNAVNADYNFWNACPGLEKTTNSELPTEVDGPCGRPLTFHHLLAKQVQKVYNAATKAAERDSAIWLAKQNELQSTWITEPSKFNPELREYLSDWELAVTSGVAPGPTLSDLFQYSVRPYLPKEHHLLKDWDIDADYPHLSTFKSYEVPDSLFQNYTSSPLPESNLTATPPLPALRELAARKCRDDCEGDPHCVTYVWDGNSCYMKGGVGGGRTEKAVGSGVVAGVFSHKFMCNFMTVAT